LAVASNGSTAVDGTATTNPSLSATTGMLDVDRVTTVGSPAGTLSLYTTEEAM